MYLYIFLLQWKTIKLKNFKYVQWQKVVNAIIKNETKCLDTRDMFIPKTLIEYECFWEQFNSSIKKAENLKSIYLYKCLPHVFEGVVKTLLQLEVLCVLLIK